jgi:hypothetical protein
MSFPLTGPQKDENSNPLIQSRVKKIMRFTNGVFINMCCRYENHLVAETGTLTVRLLCIRSYSKDCLFLRRAKARKYDVREAKVQYVPEREREHSVTSKHKSNAC